MVQYVSSQNYLGRVRFPDHPDAGQDSIADMDIDEEQGNELSFPDDADQPPWSCFFSAELD